MSVRGYAILSLLFLGVLAYGLNYSQYLGTDWQFKTVHFANGDGYVDRQLKYDPDQGLYLEVKTSDEFTGIWRIWKVIPHPPADEFYISFKVWVYAPNIDLDLGNAGNAAGEEPANDGPNIFSFLYFGNNGTSLENPGFNPDSFSWFPLNGEMCHIHVECNYIGPLDKYIYCMSETTYKGWLFDGKALGDAGAVNKYDSEPIEQEKWHTVVMKIDAGECMRDNLTLVIMGADIENNREYLWKISDIKIYDANETVSYSLPLDHVYDVEDGKYLPAPAYCGDGIKQTPNMLGQNEECDGNDGVPYGFKCTEDCKLEPVCGDGKVVDGEVCDGSSVKPGYECSSDCKSLVPICGDGMVVEGELCDGNNVPLGFKCSSDCKSMQPICGDGIVAGSEECDDNASVEPGYMCVNCHLIKDIGPGAGLLDEVASKKVENGSSEIIEYTSDSEVTLKAEYIQAYLNAKGYPVKVEICNENACEPDYVPKSGSITLVPGTNYLKVFNKNGTYYLGIKGSGPSFSLDISNIPTFWLLVAVGLLLFVGFLFIVIIAVVAYFVVLKRKKGKIRLG